MQFEINSLEDSKDFATYLASIVRWPDCLCFSGNLGAGKTTIIKYLLKNLGVDEEVTSPTFNLVSYYFAQNDKKIWHYDLYRLKYEEEVIDLAIEDALADLVIIEWPEKASSFLPKKRIEIKITTLGEKRIINLTQFEN